MKKSKRKELKLEGIASVIVNSEKLAEIYLNKDLDSFEKKQDIFLDIFNSQKVYLYLFVDENVGVKLNVI